MHSIVLLARLWLLECTIDAFFHLRQTDLMHQLEGDNQPRDGK